MKVLVLVVVLLGSRADDSVDSAGRQLVSVMDFGSTLSLPSAHGWSFYGYPSTQERQCMSISDGLLVMNTMGLRGTDCYYNFRQDVCDMNEPIVFEMRARVLEIEGESAQNMGGFTVLLWSGLALAEFDIESRLASHGSWPLPKDPGIDPSHFHDYRVEVSLPNVFKVYVDNIFVGSGAINSPSKSDLGDVIAFGDTTLGPNTHSEIAWVSLSCVPIAPDPSGSAVPRLSPDPSGSAVPHTSPVSSVALDPPLVSVLDFSSMQSLPSAHGWSFDQGTQESRCASISNGLLTINTMGLGEVTCAYLFVDFCDMNRPVVFSMRARVREFEREHPQNLGGFLMLAWSANVLAEFDIESHLATHGGVSLPHDPGIDPAHFHDYRMEVSLPNVFKVYVDNAFVGSGTVDNTNEQIMRHEVVFGDSTLGPNAHSEIAWASLACFPIGPDPSGTPVPRPSPGPSGSAIPHASPASSSRPSSAEHASPASRPSSDESPSSPVQGTADVVVDVSQPSSQVVVGVAVGLGLFVFCILIAAVGGLCWWLRSARATNRSLRELLSRQSGKKAPTDDADMNMQLIEVMGEGERSAGEFAGERSVGECDLGMGDDEAAA